MQMGTLDMDTIRFGGRVPEKDAGDVGKFLNRILGLPVHKQNKVLQSTQSSINNVLTTLLLKQQGLKSSVEMEKFEFNKVPKTVMKD